MGWSRHCERSEAIEGPPDPLTQGSGCVAPPRF